MENELNKAFDDFLINKEESLKIIIREFINIGCPKTINDKRDELKISEAIDKEDIYDLQMIFMECFLMCNDKQFIKENNIDTTIYVNAIIYAYYNLNQEKDNYSQLLLDVLSRKIEY